MSARFILILRHILSGVVSQRWYHRPKVLFFPSFFLIEWSSMPVHDEYSQWTPPLRTHLMPPESLESLVSFPGAGGRRSQPLTH